MLRRPGEDCPAEDLLCNEPLYFWKERGEGAVLGNGGSAKIVPLGNYQATYIIQSSTVDV